MEPVRQQASGRERTVPDCEPLHVDLISHCDWSKSAHKRWMTTVVLRADGDFSASGPERIDNPGQLISSLRDRVLPRGAILVGFDFPIGLPASYASSVRVCDFPSVLPTLGKTPFWNELNEIARTHQEIRPHRPSLPPLPRWHQASAPARRSGCGSARRPPQKMRQGASRQETRVSVLLDLRGAAGRAATSGWCEVLAPALQQDPNHFFVWPFGGGSIERLQAGSVVVAETYPAEYYRHLGVRFGPGVGGKSSRDARRANAAVLIGVATALNVHPRRNSRTPPKAAFRSNAAAMMASMPSLVCSG